MTLIDRLWIKLALKLVIAKGNFVVFFYRLTCAWGIFIAIPYFHVFNTAPAFSFMAQFFNEQVWGMFIFLIGVCLWQSYKSGNTLYIRNSLFITFCIWLLISIMLFISSKSTGSVVTYPIFTYYIFREFLIYSQRYSILRQEKNQHVFPD